METKKGWRWRCKNENDSDSSFHMLSFFTFLTFVMCFNIDCDIAVFRHFCFRRFLLSQNWENRTRNLWRRYTMTELWSSYYRHLSLFVNRLSLACHPSLSLHFIYPFLQCSDYIVSFSFSRALSSSWSKYQRSVAWEITTAWYMTWLVSLQEWKVNIRERYIRHRKRQL